MTYKASELIATALRLADLQNTAFPSAAENREYINLAWLNVYEEAINSGLKYFFEVTEMPRTYTIDEETFTDYSLPDDFYQLYDLKDLKGNRIRRKQRNSLKTEKWYDLVKNNLIVNEISEPLIMEYFPKPVELDPSETGDVDLDFPDHFFYHLVSLYLARYYKIKQGGDFSGIELLIEEGWDTYLNILERDLDQPLVITDVENEYRRII